MTNRFSQQRQRRLSSSVRSSLPLDAFKKELEAYETILGECKEDMLLKGCTLEFWSTAGVEQGCGDVLPKLRMTAAAILGIPISSAEQERGFSSAKNTDFRPAMKGHTLGKLCFLKARFLSRYLGDTDKSKSMKKCAKVVKYKFLTHAHTREVRLTVSSNVADDGADADPEEALEEGSVVSALEKPRYDGDIEECPSEVKSLKEHEECSRGSYVSVYFGPPENKWYEGQLWKVNRRLGADTATDNVQVNYPEENDQKYNLLFTVDNYGPDQLWVIPKGKGGVKDM
jgi:hypothetical protein